MRGWCEMWLVEPVPDAERLVVAEPDLPASQRNGTSSRPTVFTAGRMCSPLLSTAAEGRPPISSIGELGGFPKRLINCNYFNRHGTEYRDYSAR